LKDDFEIQHYRLRQSDAKLRQERKKEEFVVKNSKLTETVKALDTKCREQILSASRRELDAQRKEQTALRHRILAINALNLQTEEKMSHLRSKIEKRKLEADSLRQDIIALKKAKTETHELLATNCKGYDDATNCSICFLDKQTHSIIPCGHSFCGDCVTEWARLLPASCPICRGPMMSFMKVHGIIVDKVFEMRL
jgi:hypothetical protein